MRLIQRELCGITSMLQTNVSCSSIPGYIEEIRTLATECKNNYCAIKFRSTQTLITGIIELNGHHQGEKTWKITCFQSEEKALNNSKLV